nr:MAG TPA: hypothetical protein [Caudoviricetes sp.]
MSRAGGNGVTAFPCNQPPRQNKTICDHLDVRASKARCSSWCSAARTSEYPWS